MDQKQNDAGGVPGVSFSPGRGLRVSNCLLNGVRITDKVNLAYVIGIALGGGNLSNPNRRAVRLRVSCDSAYPRLLADFSKAIQRLMPNNKVSFIKHKNSRKIDISCYSNTWPKLLGWKWDKGPKHKQKVGIPPWIKTDKRFIYSCLRGLFQTDGCIYKDRGYRMVNFTGVIKPLVYGVKELMEAIGFNPKMYKFQTTKLPRYNLRLSKDVDKFIHLIKLYKK